MKIIYGSRKCRGCKKVFYHGVMIRTTYFEKNRYYCDKNCFWDKSMFDKYFEIGWLEFVEIRTKWFREKLLNKLIEQVKQTPYPFGIEIKKYNLMSEEKRFLVDKGLSLHGPGRHKSMILTYPQYLRARDLKEKVYKKRGEK